MNPGPPTLADLARTIGLEAEAHENLAEALRSVSPPARVLVFGSLYVAGEALAANDQAPD